MFNQILEFDDFSLFLSFLVVTIYYVILKFSVYHSAAWNAPLMPDLMP
jgi:hypothetical protein